MAITVEKYLIKKGTLRLINKMYYNTSISLKLLNHLNIIACILLSLQLINKNVLSIHVIIYLFCISLFIYYMLCKIMETDKEHGFDILKNCNINIERMYKKDIQNVVSNKR